MASVRVSIESLLSEIEQLAGVGAIPNGGVCRLALTDEDKQGRDHVIERMTQLGLSIVSDPIGNVCGRFLGRDPSLAPVMMGSHIDTVRTGGRLDGNLGVLAGLEVIRACQAQGVQPLRSLEVAFFTNEEGSRFPPDMMGSLVYAGTLPLEEARAKRDAEGVSVGEELERLGLAGSAPIPGQAPFAFVELHIEQGPLLDAHGESIGVVEAVQGISWQRLRLSGQSNHAGTTPIGMRRDAGLAASRIHLALHDIVTSFGGDMVGTVGRQSWHPNLVNVVPSRVEMTIDLRSPVEEQLREAEAAFAQACLGIADACGVELESEQLVRLEPVTFDPRIVHRIEELAQRSGIAHRRMVSGAGHDAQVIGQMAPAGMIFVPSIAGVSHNPADATSAEDFSRWTQLLADVVLDLAECVSEDRL